MEFGGDVVSVSAAGKVTRGPSGGSIVLDNEEEEDVVDTPPAAIDVRGWNNGGGGMEKEVSEVGEYRAEGKDDVMDGRVGWMDG